jgi:hypothetical protein
MDVKYGLGKYYPGKPHTAEWACVDVADIGNNERGCSENSLNQDLATNLTKAQAYTAEQIQLARSSKSIDRYTSPNSTDLLIRIPINRIPGNWTNNIMFKNDSMENTKRIYFGPVKLVKFKVRLLNDKGFEVNLHERDWSFSCIVSQLYQF